MFVHAGPSRRVILLPLMFAIAHVLLPGCWAAAAESSDDIAARVSGTPIYVADVDQQLATALGPRQVDQSARSRLRYEMLQKLIDQQLALAYLQKRGLAVNDPDVQLSVQRLEQQMAARQLTLTDYLEERNLTRERLEQQLRWTLSWKMFLDRYLTEANLERYFQLHQAEFDGTRLRMAHILWKVDDQTPLDEAKQAASQLRAKIDTGEITFDAAARQYSQAPTASKGGEIGWIERRQPMPESFSQAAYQLSAGQISAPVVTHFGVHLLKCLEIERGTQSWTDVRPQLADAFTAYLFQNAAEAARGDADIELTGVIPPPPTTE